MLMTFSFFVYVCYIFVVRYLSRAISINIDVARISVLVGETLLSGVKSSSRGTGSGSSWRQRLRKHRRVRVLVDVDHAMYLAVWPL